MPRKTKIKEEVKSKMKLLSKKKTFGSFEGKKVVEIISQRIVGTNTIESVKCEDGCTYDRVI